MAKDLVSHVGRLALDVEEADVADLVSKFTMQCIISSGWQLKFCRYTICPFEKKYDLVHS